MHTDHIPGVSSTRFVNAEIERALQQLIDEHGIDKIDKALEPLIAKVPWQDWQLK